MPGYTKIKQAVDFLGLAGTFGNPQLKVTVFVPNDNVSRRVGGAKSGSILG